MASSPPSAAAKRYRGNSLKVFPGSEDFVASTTGAGSEMNDSFEVEGPKEVKALPFPRRNSKGASPQVASARPSVTESDLDRAEALDHFEDFPAPPAVASQPSSTDRKAWAAQSPNQQGATVSETQRWSPSLRISGSDFSSSTSLNFSVPLAAEGEGSVFPIELDLNRRRELEEDFIRRFDRQDINTHVGEFWFLIDAIWMTNWVQFIMGKKEPPGPISNYNLYNQKTPTSAARRESMLVKHAADARGRGGAMAARPDLSIKPGLKKIRDYRAVHPIIWYVFREMYATDDSPEICRWKADMYSDEVSISRKLKVDQAMHTKACYELRRLSGRIKEEVLR